MGKYYDMLTGDAPSQSKPAKAPASQSSTKYQDMLFGNTEIRETKPGFTDKAVASVSPIDESSKMAGMGAQAVASLPTNPRERAAYYAKQRFPNDPNAIARYGVQDGRIFYEGDDGKYYFEEPAAKLGQFGKFLSSMAGPALPAAGSIVGGMAGAASPVPGGAYAGASGGAATGDAARQALAMQFAGQQGYDPWQTGGEAAMGAAGEAGGRLIAGGVNRMLFKGASLPDISRMDDPAVREAMQALEEKATQSSIQLTPAELSNLRSLKTQQNVLGDLPASADTMQDFYRKRNEVQVPQAIERMMGDVSPQSSAEVGAVSLREGAKDTIAAERKFRAEAAKPYYDASRNAAVPGSQYQELMKDPFLRSQIKSVARTPKYQSDLAELAGDDKIPLEAKIGFLDVVKKRIDGMIAESKNPNDRRIYQNAKTKLLGILDEASPEYKQARAIFEEGSPPVTALEKGEVGLAANAKNTNLGSIPRTIFTSGPDSIRANRDAFLKAGKESEWNDGLRAYLTENFDRASKEYISGNANPGARFRSLVFGTPKQRASLQSAMTRDQWAGLNRLMDVLEATGRVPQGGSRTAFSQEVIKDMKGQSGAVAKKVLNPARVLRDLSDTYESFRLGKNSEAIAKIITSPDSMSKLKELRTLSPKSRRAIIITHQLLMRAGIGEIEDAIQPNVKPGEF